MNERIRMVREKNKLSRAAFGEKLGVSGDVINNLERGRVDIKDSIIKLICSVYLVNEDWLRTGEGEMFVQRPEEDELKQAIDSMLKGRNPSFKRRLITVLASLNDADWLVLEEKVLELAEAARLETNIVNEETESTEAAEALYRSSSGYVASADLSASTSTGGTEKSDGAKLA